MPKKTAMPYVFCTREKYPWCELAENVMTGAATSFLSGVSKKFY
jgi:beta-ureidopropionase